MPITIFLQARMSSKRLPGKVLFYINNKTIIDHIFTKLKKIKLKKKIIILTSTNKSDNAIMDHCKKIKLECFRGNLNNVYKRYYDAIKKYKIKEFVRINGDSPLIDPKIITRAIKLYSTKNYEIVTNCMKRTYPKGQSVEIINSKTFLQNYKFIKSKKNKEHIFTYFYKNKKKFKICNFESKVVKNEINQSIDTFQDYLTLKKKIENKL